MGTFSALAAAGGPVIGGLIVHWTTYHWILVLMFQSPLLHF